MGKKDVWVRIAGKTFNADAIRGIDENEPSLIRVRVVGESDSPEIATRGESPAVVARGLLDAVAACAADGGHWLLSFEDDARRTGAEWVRSELGRGGMPALRRDHGRPAAASASGVRREVRRGPGLEERERERLRAQAPAHWKVPGSGND